MEKRFSRGENIAILSLGIFVIVSIVLFITQNCIETNRKQKLVLGKNTYNSGLINMYKTALESPAVSENQQNRN